MSFDIHRLDKLSWEGDYEPLYDYQEALVEQFLESPEGQAFAEAHPDTEPGFWPSQMVEYGFIYAETTLPKMTAAHAEQLVTQIFPRKISLFSAKDAEGAVSEMIAFWQFLQREYGLSQAEQIITYLRQVEPRFPEILMDPSKFGMAKSFVMQGQAAGFDMTDKEEINQFMTMYNARILEEGSGAFPPLPGQSGGRGRKSVTDKAKAKRKKARKQARASRRKSRKKRK